jgi:hypothetical protein
MFPVGPNPAFVTGGSRRYPVVVNPQVQIVEQHILVVPQEEHASLLLLELEQIVDYGSGIGTTVQVIAQKDQPVFGAELLVPAQNSQQFYQGF